MTDRTLTVLIFTVSTVSYEQDDTPVMKMQKEAK